MVAKVFSSLWEGWVKSGLWGLGMDEEDWFVDEVDLTKES